MPGNRLTTRAHRRLELLPEVRKEPVQDHLLRVLVGAEDDLVVLLDVAEEGVHPVRSLKIEQAHVGIEKIDLKYGNEI